jgi:maleylpyruvate isomerase
VFESRSALRGLNVSHEFIHLRNGKQISTNYLAINPAGLVPYWVEGDLNFAQSIAIIEYLEETYPDPPLLPRDPASRAIVREVALAVCCDIHPIGNLRVLNQLQTLGVGEAAAWIGPGTGSTPVSGRLRHDWPDILDHLRSVSVPPWQTSALYRRSSTPDGSASI